MELQILENRQLLAALEKHKQVEGWRLWTKEANSEIQHLTTFPTGNSRGIVINFTEGEAAKVGEILDPESGVGQHTSLLGDTEKEKVSNFLKVSPWNNKLNIDWLDFVS